MIGQFSPAILGHFTPAFTLFGNTAIDVSIKNLGYDIISTTPNGEKRYIEVKSVKKDYSFSLTNNEYTAAHE